MQYDLQMQWFKDPLFLFIAIGALIYVVSASVPQESDVIHVKRADLVHYQLTQVQGLREDEAALRIANMPTAQLQALASAYGLAEMKYREALKLGLHGDQTFKAELVRRYDELMRLSLDVQISAAELSSEYRDHPDQYTQPATYSFEHLFFASLSAAEIERMRETLQERHDNAGDPFLYDRTYVRATKQTVAAHFGQAFADTLATITPDPVWQGPFRSQYGQHLVWLVSTSPPSLRSYDEVEPLLKQRLIERKIAEAEAAHEVYLRNIYKLNVNLTQHP